MYYGDAWYGEAHRAWGGEWVGVLGAIAADLPLVDADLVAIEAFLGTIAADLPLVDADLVAIEAMLGTIAADLPLLEWDGVGRTAAIMQRISVLLSSAGGGPQAGAALTRAGGPERSAVVNGPGQKETRAEFEPDD